MDALIDNASPTNPRRHVPIKDSTLTWLLSDVLQNQNARAALICCVSSHPRDLEETVLSLQFAKRFRSLTMSVRINEEKCNVVVHAIQQEMASIQAKLVEAAKNNVQEDLTKLQEQLLEKSRQLHDEKSRKNKAQADLHTQLESTAKELQLVQAMLQSKQLVADKSRMLEGEATRLLLTRDAQVKQIQQEEALCREAQRQIEEAVVLEKEIARLRQERVALEEKAKQEQKRQSQRMMRTIFTTATTIERDRALMKELKGRNERLRQSILMRQADIVQCNRRRKLMDNLIATLTTQLDHLRDELPNATRAKDAVSAAIASECESLERTTNLVLENIVVEREQLEHLTETCGAVIEAGEALLVVGRQRQRHTVQQTNPVVARTSRQRASTTALTDASKALCVEVDRLEENLSQCVAECYSAESAVEQCRHDIIRERHFIVHAESSLKSLDKQNLLIDDAIAEIMAQISGVEVELEMLQREHAVLDKRLREESVGKHLLDVEMGELSPQSDTVMKGTLAGESACLDGAKMSRAFRAQHDAMASSPLMRRFVK